MYKLITSTYNEDNEINTLEESVSLNYLEEKGTDLYLNNEIDEAYIVDDDKVIEEMYEGEFKYVRKSVLPTTLVNVRDCDKIIRDEIQVTVTTYADEDDEEGENSYITISKQATLKELKKILKSTYKVSLKNMSFQDDEDKYIDDDSRLVEIGFCEGSMYNKNNCFDMLFFI